MSFTDDQKSLLAQPLNRGHVKSRKQGGRDVSYIEGWHAIAEANRIFGFDGWTRETVEIKCVSERERTIGNQQKPGWGVSYTAKVRVIAQGVAREGVGAGHGIDADLGQAHESAIKEAETDAMKRALMTFGNPFGLALYDKEQANVVDEPDADGQLRFIEECKAKIASFQDGDYALGHWWNSTAQKTARRDWGLSPAQVDDLKALVIPKLPKQGVAA